MDRVDFWDLVKFAMCAQVSRVHITFYILIKGHTVPENQGTHDKLNQIRYSIALLQKGTNLWWFFTIIHKKIFWYNKHALVISKESKDVIKYERNLSRIEKYYPKSIFLLMKLFIFLSSLFSLYPLLSQTHFLSLSLTIFLSLTISLRHTHTHTHLYLY